jgi:hypothetical protein
VLDVDVCDDGVADDGEGEGEEHDDAAEFEAVGEDGDDDGEDGGDGVGDDGPELDFVGGVAAEGLDDGGELGVSVCWSREKVGGKCAYEKTKGVETGEDAEVGEGAEPAGDAQHSALYFGPVYAVTSVINQHYAARTMFESEKLT